MTPTQSLMTEHRLIERILAVLEALGHQSLHDHTIDRGRALDVLLFLKEFADRCHHGKEEKHLFPMLAEHGFGPEMGPVAVMLGEHELGRVFLREMTAAVEAADRPDSSDRFARAAAGYVSLLTAHIQKEDQILFPMADRVFSPEDQATVAGGFERVELEEMGPGAHEKFHALAERLLARVTL